MKQFLFIALAIPFLFSCEKDEEANVTELTFEKTITLNELELENFQRLTVYKYSSEGAYQGRF